LGRSTRLAAIFGVLLVAVPLDAQSAPPAGDAVLQSIWREGTERSQVRRLAQTLLDSLGPRLTGSPESEAASNWLIALYKSWGIEARQERYGTWTGWKRGVTSVGLVAPRARTLEGVLLAWSPGTNGSVSGAAVTLPMMRGPADLDAFLATVRGKFVLLAPAEPSCRPSDSWEKWGTRATIDAMTGERAAAYREWSLRVRAAGISGDALIARLEAAGAAGFVTSEWAEGWGVDYVYTAYSDRIPTLQLSCEDFGLVFRLAENRQGPVLRVDAEAELLANVPVWNTIAVIPGREIPNEYVVLSAHFDSWDAASGATDNGTGTIAMTEALRILKSSYPNPKRTILVGHWNGEEQGLNGSRAFAADHPEIVRGLQALFNQDEGTGRITRISMQGLTGAQAVFRRWFAKLPPDLTQGIELIDPGVPTSGGSDESSFICGGAPAFRLTTLSWDYNPYTWHTNRDTYDKVVFDEVERNATFIAMLAYLASEDAERFPRDRAALPANPQTGQPTAWPVCRDAVRSSP
jgi:carboxypeptidase Q